MKTKETLEEVSSHPGEKGHWRQKSIGTPPPPEKSGERTRKKTCKSVEQAENHEKGPRCSWARNQMGNSGLSESLKFR
jgi:hypothetical protein